MQFPEDILEHVLLTTRNDKKMAGHQRAWAGCALHIHTYFQHFQQLVLSSFLRQHQHNRIHLHHSRYGVLCTAYNLAVRVRCVHTRKHALTSKIKNATDMKSGHLAGNRTAKSWSLPPIHGNNCTLEQQRGNCCPDDKPVEISDLQQQQQQLYAAGVLPAIR